MEEYKKQAEGQANSSSDLQQGALSPSTTSSSSPSSSSSSSSAPSPMGMMQLPGRRGRGKNPMDLVQGAVSDSTYEATILGELAVINIEQDVSVCVV